MGKIKKTSKKMELSIKTRFFNMFRFIFKIPALEKKLVMLTENHVPNAFVAKLVPNNYQYKPNTVRQAVRNEISLKLDISDYLEHAVYFGYKDEGQKELFKLCKQGDVVIDIGTNIGYVLLNFAKGVGSEGYVYGFEPNPITYTKCLENIRLNKFSNINVSNVGLGDIQTEGEISILHADNRGTAFIAPISSSRNNTKVNIITLDYFVQNHNIQRINIIKIDVEGYELNVLRGAQTTLKKFKPTLFIEMDDNLLRRQNTSPEQLMTFIEGFGYYIMRADTGRIISSSDILKDIHIDIICKISS